MIIYALIILTVTLAVMLALSIAALSKLTKMIYSIDEQIEESLEILDKSYRSIDNVLATPVFYDDPLVKQTLKAIKRSQDAILLIANKISNYNEVEEDIADEEERLT